MQKGLYPSGIGNWVLPTLEEYMTRQPATVEPDLLATGALNLMEEQSITSLMVVDERHRIIGVIHLHDL